jgi:hypothetical protein
MLQGGLLKGILSADLLLFLAYIVGVSAMEPDAEGCTVYSVPPLRSGEGGEVLLPPYPD